MNYCVVLGVTRDASYEAIRQAFRALARQYHPDAGAGSSVERFSALQRAGVISYSHGRGTVRDRNALEAAACPCYGVMRAQLRKLRRDIDERASPRGV